MKRLNNLIPLRAREVTSKKGAVSIMQIMILVIGIVAISWAVGSEVGFVSAVSEGDICLPEDNLKETIIKTCKEGDIYSGLACHSSATGTTGGNVWKWTHEPGVDPYMDCPAFGDKICVEGQGCVDSPKICTPNSFFCEVNNLMQCSVNGKSKDVLKPCPNGCEEGKCIDEIMDFSDEKRFDFTLGDCFGGKGICLPVTVDLSNWVACSPPNEKHKCISEEWVSQQSCDVGGKPGKYKYAECDYPDLDGDGMTSLCCVPTETTEAEGCETDDECTDPNLPICEFDSGQCVQCDTPNDCKGEGQEKYVCTNNVCVAPGDGKTPFDPSPFMNFLTFGLASDKFAGDNYGEWVENNSGAYFKGAMGAGAIWAGIAGGAAALILPTTGAGAGATTAMTAALSTAIMSGFMAKGLMGVIGGEGGVGVGAGFISAGIGLGIGAGLFMLLYHEEAKRKKTFDSNPWEAQFGGDHCEECNDEIFGCTEYQCKSLGQACEIINAGTDEEMCVHMDRHDTNPPEIIPWEAALLNENDYTYNPDSTINPPDNGVYIVYEGEESTSDGFGGDVSCIPAFTPFSFGITVLNGPAKCKIDTDLKQNFSDMLIDFGGSSTAKYNHSQTMSLPGPSVTENQDVVLENGGDFDLYVKCVDHNGIESVGSFVFKFCVNDGPDSTAPLIITTDPLAGFPFGFNVTELDINLYVNEPAKCRWSHLDEIYENMEENYPNQICDTGEVSSNVNSQMLFPCKVELDGLNDGVENTFYFRCQDQPTSSLPEEQRNTNIESYVYTLEGSQPLVITEVTPNKTIKGSTNSIKVDLTVKTFAGFEEGKSNCEYSETGNEEDYTLFIGDSLYENFMHHQELWKGQGTYKYYIKCVDLAGNSDYSDTTFTIDTDTDAPIVTRVYHEEVFLKVITDEKSDCVYSFEDCTYDFEDGLPMEVHNDINHFTDWETNTNYYVKCKDEYGNMPAPDKCSIKVRPFETYLEEIL